MGGKGRTGNGDVMDHQQTVGIRCDSEEFDLKILRCNVWQLHTLIERIEVQLAMSVGIMALCK